MAARLGVKIAANWVTRLDGSVVEEEVDVPDKFFLAPTGGTREQGSHKGYGLACVADLLSNTLQGTGAGFLTGGGGITCVAYNIEAFAPRAEFDKWLAPFLKGLRTCPPSPGNERVLYPGLYAHETR